MNRTLLILIILLVASIGVLIHLHYSEDDGVLALSDGNLDDNEPAEEANPSDYITVSNSDWGSVIKVLNASGTLVAYQAVPEYGCSFVAWLDSQGRYIELSETILLDKLSVKGTVALFDNHPSAPLNMKSYSWKMPTFTFDQRGEMIYESKIYSFGIRDADLREYQNRDVSRRASDSQATTSWQLVTDDPAVRDIAEYLSPIVSGMDDTRKAWVVMCFVQDVIKYKADSAQYGRSEYWAFPIETMSSGYGDCEDTAILFCSVSSMLGLDTGLVSFTYSDVQRKSLGHMGAAVALDEISDSRLFKGTEFDYNGTRYCYVETSTDSRLSLGYLMKYSSVQAYYIEDGCFTHMIYDRGSGFTHEELVPISGEFNSSIFIAIEFGFNADSTVYGDDFTSPPMVELEIGDMFSYIPQTSLPCIFSASGDGLVSEGGIFSFNNETFELSGKAIRTGEYSVTIKAETIEAPYQVAYQNITFKVYDVSIQDDGPVMKSISFTNGSWNVDTIYQNDSSGDMESEKNNSSEMAIYVLIAIIACIGGIFLARRFM